MTPKELQALTRKHIAVIEGIDDILIEAKVTGKEGEILLLFLAGISAGNRQAPINGREWNTPTALAWAFGAEHGDG